MITENPTIIMMVTSIALTYAKTRNHLLTDMKGLSKKKIIFLLSPSPVSDSYCRIY